MNRRLAIATVIGIAAVGGVRALSAWLSAAIDDALDVPLTPPGAVT